jgi:hypothetical protein
LRRRAPERSWTQDTPTFFLGASDIAIKPNKPFELRVSIEVEPAGVAAADTAQIDAQPIPVEQAFVPQSRPIQIIPKPKSLKWLDGRFPLTPDTIVYVPEATFRAAGEVLCREAADRFGWSWHVSPQFGGHKPPFTIQVLRARNDPALGDEGYRIEFGEELTVTAAHPRAQRVDVQERPQPRPGRGPGDAVRVRRVEPEDV